MDTTVQNTPDLATEQRIRKETTKDGLEVTRLFKGAYQKDKTLTAEIKQTVKTSSFYPTKSVSNDMQDNVFGIKDFGFQENEPYENIETRVAWIDVPTTSTIESVVESLKGFPNATLYKVLSNRPILTSDQKRGIAGGLTTMETIANRQVVRYPDSHRNAKSLVVDENGKVQYRQIYFKRESVADMDLRTSDVADVYLTEEIKNELEEAGQKVI